MYCNNNTIMYKVFLLFVTSTIYCKITSIWICVSGFFQLASIYLGIKLLRYELVGGNT